MNKFIKYSFCALFILSVGIFSGCNNKTNKVQPKIDSVRVDSIKIDSIKKANLIQDSINQCIVKELQCKFINKVDEFTGTTWVIPKTAPKYRNINGTYCYFAKSESAAYNFRFVLQYAADDWLFIRHLYFNIDGRNLVFRNVAFDRDNNTKIWEWCDLAVESPTLITMLENAKTVKIKMEGLEYEEVRILNAKTLKSIQNTIKYYKALGGTF